MAKTCFMCEYNDGCVYTSIPPQYKCSIDNEFHFGDYKCDKEFVPVKHGHWITYEDEGWTIYECSNCGKESPSADTYYCPLCGAKMDEDK